MEKPTIQGDATKEEDPNHPFVEVTTLCFIPKAMKRHTQYANTVPFGELPMAPTTPAAASLDLQMGFDKAMEGIVAALKPRAELKYIPWPSHRDCPQPASYQC
jgi:hypothetical protein